MFGFEKLEVWQRAVEFADDVYRMTQQFPDDEKFGLVNQMRRAAVSISSNIAEGSSRESHKEFIRFLQIAYGSLMEVVSQLHIAQRQEFLPNDRARDLYRAGEEIARMISGLKRSLSART